jgi:uncharacterized repeat protein (TIGR01451 family)
MIIDGNGDNIAIVDMGAYEFGAYIQISKEILYTSPPGYGGTNQYVPGGNLTFCITYKNIGDGTATNSSLEDKMPEYTYYASSTLRMGTIASTYDTAGPKTDASDSDNAEYIDEKACFRIGTVGIGQGGRVYFRVYVR